ncbi:hypothetical protein Tco_0408762 [Tanacetum coccineum]
MNPSSYLTIPNPIGTGYSQKDKNKAKTDKTKHMNEKSVKRRRAGKWVRMGLSVGRMVGVGGDGRVGRGRGVKVRRGKRGFGNGAVVVVWMDDAV